VIAPQTSLRLAACVVLALLAFAGNSLLCRAALAGTGIDPASFTAIRLAAGALTLAALVGWRGHGSWSHGSWRSALPLFVYAGAFSWAYRDLTAATGALLLFGAVHATMLAAGVAGGERLRPAGLAGVLVGLAGLLALLWPGLSAPPLVPALLMLAAGVAWGGYSLRGRGGGDPLVATAGNFLRTVPMAGVLLVAAWPTLAPDAAGAGYAVASGAITSGLGYALWFAALPALRSITAASLQLSVPVITGVAGVLLLAEPLAPRLLLAGAAILGGIALVIRARA
jgi:drug/metabolite transporter (DMT)-like permease